jgi:hypothetical protein
VLPLLSLSLSLSLLLLNLITHALLMQVAGASEARRDPEAVPVYLAMVDLCCSEDTLELLRSALQAALEALPAAARFGIVTFSHKVM